MSKKTLVSVVIPTYNEENDIYDCLTSLIKQSYKNIEIVVVDDGSTDKTREIVKKFRKANLFKGQHRGPGFSRNLGAQRANGNILVFVDADMTFHKNYLKNLVRPILEDKEIIGTTHDYEVVTNLNNIWSRCWGMVRVSKKNAGEVKIFRAIRKDKFFEFGCFDPKYGYADDQTFWFKYGVRPCVASRTTCFHKNPETLKQVYKQSRWIGASLNSPLLQTLVIRHMSLFFLYLLSPINILILAIKKCLKNKEFTILPHMLLFVAARYYGTLAGIIRRIFLDVNWR